MRPTDGIVVEYTKADGDTTIVTTEMSEEWVAQRSAEILKSALEQFGASPQSSVIPSDTTSTDELTLELIDELANGLNSDKEKVLKANRLLLRILLEDAYFGVAFQAITSNINTDYKMIYGTDWLEDGDADELKQVKDEVDYFCKSIDLPQMIRDVISRVYAEGNAVLVLRCEDGDDPILDIVPLDLAYPSEYRWGGRSVVEFDIKQLEDRLKKTYKKSRKTRKPIHLVDTLEKEIKLNYPDEVFQAFKNRENYARVDPRYSDCVKINDLGRKFGVSPLFRCLRPVIILRQIEAADVSDSKARAKKILHQKLRKETLGSEGRNKGLELTAYAHNQLVQGMKQKNVAITTPPFVEDLQYVQIKNTSEQTVKQQELYTQKLLAGLGILFVDPQSSVSAGQISIKQIVRLINSIAENFCSAMNKLLRSWVEDNGHDAKFAPTLSIGDASQLEPEMQRELATFAYNMMGLSRKTALHLVGLDYEDERAARAAENADKDEEVFYPRQTAYTTGSGSEYINTYHRRGRPRGNQTDRQQYDEEYTDNVR